MAAYLTYEFLTIHSPQSLSRLRSPEIKLWLCPFTSMPVFSSAPLGGPNEFSTCGLPTIGFPTIHIRVPENVADLQDESSRAHILRLVYTQINTQLNSLVMTELTDANLEPNIRSKQKQIDLLGILLNQTEPQNATAIIH